MALIHLIYVSSAVTEMDDVELESILESSVRHNTTQGVTGMLLYRHGRFIQVLEGLDVSVDETMNRINKDIRHHAVVVLERTAITARSFAKWSMGFHRLNDADFLQNPNYVAFFDPDFNAEKHGVQQGLALRMLRDFANKQHSPAE